MHLEPQGDIHCWVKDWLEPRKYSPQIQLALVGHEPIWVLGRNSCLGSSQSRSSLEKSGYDWIKITRRRSSLKSQSDVLVDAAHVLALTVFALRGRINVKTDTVMAIISGKFTKVNLLDF